MRVMRLVPCALLATVLAGCADQPLMPAEDSTNSAFAVGGTDRPFKAALSVEVHWQYDWADPVCPVLTMWAGSGTASHLGEVYVQGAHCAPITRPTYENGHWELTAANGDVLTLEYGGWPANLRASLPLPMQVANGTGRFADASGTIYVDDFKLVGEWGDDGNPIEPWYGWFSFEGAISY